MLKVKNNLILSLSVGQEHMFIIKMHDKILLKNDQTILQFFSIKVLLLLNTNFFFTYDANSTRQQNVFVFCNNLIL
jgi:hypothetical protein